MLVLKSHNVNQPGKHFQCNLHVDHDFFSWTVTTRNPVSQHCILMNTMTPRYPISLLLPQRLIFYGFGLQTCTIDSQACQWKPIWRTANKVPLSIAFSFPRFLIRIGIFLKFVHEFILQLSSLFNANSYELLVYCMCVCLPYLLRSFRILRTNFVLVARFFFLITGQNKNLLKQLEENFIKSWIFVSCDFLNVQVVSWFQGHHTSILLLFDV